MPPRVRTAFAHALVLVTLGCGRSKEPEPVAATTTSAPGAGPTTPADAAPALIDAAVDAADPSAAYDCAPDPRDVPDGLHDRVSFRDERAERSGYKTRAGKIALPARYKDAMPFGPGGVAAVRLDDPRSTTPWRFIDPSGKVLATPYPFDNGPDYWQEGRARIVDGRGKIGFIAATGEIVVPPTYDFAYPFCHGSARTALDGKAGYIEATGKPAPPPAADDRPLIPPSSDG